MRALIAALAALGILFGLSGPAAAAPVSYAPVVIVHEERLAVGPYELTVGFSAWPLRAKQSLDFTFQPAGGIDHVKGTLAVFAPSGEEQTMRRPPGETGLPRHPRKPDVWGLDVYALQSPGDWAFRFGLDGPQGHAEATMRLSALEPPGPPLALSWLGSTVPLIILLGLLALGLLRGRT